MKQMCIRDSSKPCFMISFVEMEVDVDTGAAKIVRIVEGTDEMCIRDRYNAVLGVQSLSRTMQHFGSPL